MELSTIPARHQHHQGRRSKHQNRHRKHRVATTQVLGSDHKGSPTLRPNRDEYAHDGDKHGLVDTWLEDIETPQLQPARNNESMSKEPGPKPRSRPGSPYRLRSPSPNKLFSCNSHDGQLFKASPRQRLGERKRPRDLVQRNSVLDLCDEQDQVRVQPGTRPVLVATESNHDSGEERSLRGSEGSVASVISEAHYHFAKKARHKTRSDRYETTRDHKPRKPGKKKKKKPGDQSKTNETRRAGDFSSAREVMDNFNSKSILSDRITMQPTVRPGLFDNGRASKDQLPDLTFHEMHFLKRPPPPKPVPRDRERARRRGERELEEVSAFFLHKGMPEASGASGRYQPTVSGASSVDRATRGGSAFSIDVPPHQSRPGEEYDYRSPEMDRESSRGASNWTWSSSYAAPVPGIRQANGVREHVLAQTSTPSPSQNALGRTREFENTGIHCVERPRQKPSATFHSKDISSTRELLAVVSADIVNRQTDMSRQKVRIIRYHDRGVMANEEAENAAGCRQKSTGAWPDPIEQPRGKTPTESPASAEILKPSRLGPEEQTANLPQGEKEVRIAAAFRAADRDSGQDRPRSPKCTMVEQLEAAAENIESQEHQKDLIRGSTSLPVHENVQPASGYYKRHVPDSHSASQDGCLGIKPRFVGDRQHGLFEAGQEDNRPNTMEDELRNNQPAHDVNLAQRIASERTSGNSHRVSHLDQPACGVRSAHRGPVGALSTAHYTLGNPSSVQMIPPNKDPGSQIVMNDWAATGSGQLLAGHFFPRAQSVLPEAADMPPPRSNRQQSLEEYIAQMENEVLCRPRDAVDDDSPILSWHAMQDNHAVYGACIPQAHQSNVDAYNQDLSGGGHLPDRSIDGIHCGVGSVMHNSDVDQEEQKFMSTFWRP